MNTLLPIVALSIALLAAAPAQAADPHAGHHAAATKNAEMSHGTVKKVDKAKGTITIAHGPLVNLGMGAMTMSFKAKDAAWLDQVKVGDAIDFVAEDVGGALTITQLQRK